MLDTNRLLEILDGWAQWMKRPTHKLGFPSSSLVMSSVGAST